ncbi:MAG: amino acid decarboxylase [Planctomycetes bacterium]|nr:amino acid decarboxylase [Planctomycetota bacterium]
MSSGDIPASTFRAAAHRVADMIADYFERVGDYPVVPKIRPGDVAQALPAIPPEQPESMDRILDDYQRLVEPNTTHWNHPGFMAYFAITGSKPGVLGEALAAALNANAMVWKTGPAATELELRVCDWLRQMVGLPSEFQGHINDTASIGTLLALAAARHQAPGLDIRRRGMAGRSDLPALTIYASEEAHSSVDKAAVTLGIGTDNVRRLPTDDGFRMIPQALEQAIDEDRRAGRAPIAVVGTAGTTSTTSVDPLRAIGAICRRERLWFHVDAAYAGSAAICPEYRALMEGWEEADSVVLNPHKWLFTPVDCSVLLVRDPDRLKAAFSLVPEYLRTKEAGVTNLMDLGVQLGRRFRALKLWMVIRAFGAEGLRERIRHHGALAREFAERVRAEPGFELCAPVPFSVVCFRATSNASPEEQDRFNERLLDRVNAAGPVFLSHTKLRGRFVLRLAVGNLGTTAAHVETAWRLIREATVGMQ